MFKKILIANRGEIVFRVIKACREKFNPPITTVAIYSDADKYMPYVKAADEAYYVGPPEPVYSYLNMAKILEVAKICGADAIHPGYGFLSENKFFAKACEEEKEITFIGSRSEAVDVMGNKVEALKLAEKAGVATLKRAEWPLSLIGSENQMDRIEKMIGYPLTVKARSGGGGVGILAANSRGEVLDSIRYCRSLAANSFKDPELYIEQYLPDASHIEVQILADEDRILHLFERDCSIQRRNQKIIEEAPVEKLTDKTRKQIHRYARSIIKRIRKKTGIPYTGAGTIEFLVDKEGNAYFLEMNTRLQVEHGVSEMVTGIDIVEWQIRIAAGERIPFNQKDIKRKGHAIEARVYPEVWDNVNKGFIPKVGSVKVVNAPTNKEGEVRIDSAISIGEAYDIQPFYETLILKLICWGETRYEAIERLGDELDRFSINGTVTNIDLLMAIIDSNTFKDNKHTTKTLESGDFLEEIQIKAGLIAAWRPERNILRNIGILS